MIISTIQKYSNRYFPVFLLYWLVVFVLYVPAAQAGRVGDFPGWVHFLNSVGFVDYINRKGSGIAGMYQFTQVLSYLFYKIFGTNAWLWHLLYITLQSLNALLLYAFSRRLFSDSALRNATAIAFWGAFLFCVCPHISEVVVWEPSFHYLLGLLFILIVLNLAQNFLNTREIKYAWWGGIVFFLSTYSLEVFYLTPIFVIILAAYYHIALEHDKKAFNKVFLYFSLPQVLLFVFYLAALRAMYHVGVAHIGKASLSFDAANFSKSLKYVFHIVFLGRYFPDTVRIKVYHFCESTLGLSIFYGLLTVIFIYLVARCRQLNKPTKAVAFFFILSMCAVGLILPLWFPDNGVVILDRYTYVPAAFISMFLALLLSRIGNTYVFTTLILLYALINARFTHRVNAYWNQSAHIVNNLLYTFPNDPSKKVLLLNLPECLQGVQMVGTRDDGEFAMMYNAIMPQKLSNPVYDVEAFYLSSPADGAHVTVVNDSTIRVTLNQWGTWWLYYGLGATSYENSDFRVNMKDAGHWYELTLKHPSNEYLLLYTVGDKWKTTDWSKKNIDQY